MSLIILFKDVSGTNSSSIIFIAPTVISVSNILTDKSLIGIITFSSLKL